ncbi:hypothetical protein H6762_00750 [Candidatus Nomurabacteria bacterium]|uniref:Uncharacterized protein n=1 Tax=Candidatus Dojkabacteria bacterium TaxID=2099670 RepID=A0A955I5A0_9BACT|nr:hypothetical protein [Candidatus Dojkabacteria bacterium]MCB9789505.1 hypothetical protein [Candidatus Nomurabacteria bacterium]
MGNIDIRTNLDVILMNYVDFISKWDYFVSSHVRESHEQKYGFSKEDQLLLDRYAEIRRVLGYPLEIELFDWAYGGFKEDARFQPLLEVIEHFRSDPVLMDELQESEKYNQKIKRMVEEKFDALSVDTLFERSQEIFKPEVLPDAIPAYLTYSPVLGSTQGGANGMGIYTQVSIDPDMEQEAGDCAGTLFHEYLHKALAPRKFFSKWNNGDGYYGVTQPEIYPDQIADFVEEVIVHSLSNVITFGEDPKGKSDKYLNDESLSKIERQHYFYMWRTVAQAVPILRDILNGDGKDEEQINRLDNLFRSIGDIKMLTEIADRNRMTADEILSSTELLSTLRHLGEVRMVGSFEYNCMTRKDIDLYIISQDLPARVDVEKVVSELLRAGFQTVGFADNHADRDTDKPDGYYIEIIHSESREKWKLDIWIVMKDDKFHARSLDVAERLKVQTKDPTKRGDLLKLKSRYELGLSWITDKYEMYELFMKDGGISTNALPA